MNHRKSIAISIENVLVEYIPNAELYCEQPPYHIHKSEKSDFHPDIIPKSHSFVEEFHQIMIFNRYSLKLFMLWDKH